MSVGPLSTPTFFNVEDALVAPELCCKASNCLSKLNDLSKPAFPATHSFPSLWHAILPGYSIFVF